MQIVAEIASKRHATEAAVWRGAGINQATLGQIMFAREISVSSSANTFLKHRFARKNMVFLEKYGLPEKHGLPENIVCPKNMADRLHAHASRYEFLSWHEHLRASGHAGARPQLTFISSRNRADRLSLSSHWQWNFVPLERGNAERRAGADDAYQGTDLSFRVQYRLQRRDVEWQLILRDPLR